MAIDPEVPKLGPGPDAELETSIRVGACDRERGKLAADSLWLFPCSELLEQRQRLGQSFPAGRIIAGGAQSPPLDRKREPEVILDLPRFPGQVMA